MSNTEPRPDQAHLRAAGIALGLLLVICHPLMVWMESFAHSAEEGSVSEPITRKNQGLALIEAAFRRADVLPVFGSSELIQDRENRASQFFQDAPTGFRVCPIGEPGNTCLLNAEKIAALGDLARGRKLVILLSFPWFNIGEVSPEEYAGNFSPLHAGVLAVDGKIDSPLRHRFALRMLHYPATLEAHPELAAYLRSLSRNDAWSRCKRIGLWSWLNLENSAMRLQDRFETVLTLWESPPAQPAPCPASKPPVLWDRILGPERRKLPADDYPEETNMSAMDPVSQQFIARIDASKEWQDLELLLDTLIQLRSRPFILCIPLHGVHMEARGIASAARARLYHRVEHLCADRGIPCESFLNHDRDPGFTRGDGHPSSKGWLYIDQKLDDFYHDRLPSDANHPLTQK